MAAFIAVRAVRAALNNGSGTLSMTNASSYATKSSVSKQKKTPPTSTPAGKSTPLPPASSTTSGLSLTKNVDPPALIFKKVSSPIGPGASKESNDYKNPEYFSYHQLSYFDMDEVMAKFRLPQPTSLKK